MNERLSELFRAIVEEYVTTALPVGSAALTKEKMTHLSSATIRKEMAILEEEGYIMHPHTSAGRIPTELGFRYYVEHFVKELPLSEGKIAGMAAKIAAQEKDPTLIIKRLAKTLAEFSEESMIVGFGPNDVYYTGISHLFQKPEFQDLGRVTTLSAVIDRFDDIVTTLCEKTHELEIRLGSETPFGDQCAMIATSGTLGEQKFLLILLGPIRMHYERNLALMRQAIALLAELHHH